MDRQTVRQHSKSQNREFQHGESEVRQRLGQPKRRQVQSARFNPAATAVKPQAKPLPAHSLPAQPLPRKNRKAQAEASARSAARKSRQYRRASFLFVLGLWSVSLITAVWATRSLLDPTLSSTNFPVASDLENPLANAEATQPEAIPVPPAAAEPVPESIAPPEAALNDSYFYQPAEAEHLPIVALGSIVVSCAMSCILVSRALHPRRSPPKLQGRSKKRTVQPAPSPLPAVVELPAEPASAKKAVPAVEIVEVIAPAAVTVLPANQSVPLDWNEPSLADSLDLRRRQSLPF